MADISTVDHFVRVFDVAEIDHEDEQYLDRALCFSLILIKQYRWSLS